LINGEVIVNKKIIVNSKKKLLNSVEVSSIRLIAQYREHIPRAARDVFPVKTTTFNLYAAAQHRPHPFADWFPRCRIPSLEASSQSVTRWSHGDNYHRGWSQDGVDVSGHC